VFSILTKHLHCNDDSTKYKGTDSQIAYNENHLTLGMLIENLKPGFRFENQNPVFGFENLFSNLLVAK